MILDRRDHKITFRIWEPRYHDKKVLLSKLKVDQPKAKRKVEHLIVELESNYMRGSWYLSRTVAKRAKVESNGVIDCYCVPLDKLQTVEISERSKYDY